MIPETKKSSKKGKPIDIPDDVSVTVREVNFTKRITRKFML